MTTAHAGQTCGGRTPGILGGRDAHGTTLNRISLPELLERYDSAGFLYPAKRERLAAHLAEASDAFQRMLGAGDELRRVHTWSAGGRWASLDLWQSAPGCWMVQHLVANGGGGGARATMLAALARGLEDPGARAWESWFRPTNPFPEAVLGGSVPVLGAHAARSDHACIAVPLEPPPAGAGGAVDTGETGEAVEVTEASGAPAELLALAGSCRHHAFATAAGLDVDPLLRRMDQRYRTVGLRRYRRIFLARDRRGELRGAALAHRGPVALNFSLLENRCDLLLGAGAGAAVARRLLTASSVAYDDFPSRTVPVAVALRPGPDLPTQAQRWAGALGGSVIQVYAQVVWLRAGLPRLADFFRRPVRRES